MSLNYRPRRRLSGYIPVTDRIGLLGIVFQLAIVAAAVVLLRFR